MDCGRYYDKAYGIVGEYPLKPWDFIRLERTFAHILKEGKLHDAGCGVGHWLEFLDRRTELELSGSDVSPDALGKATKNLKGKGINLVLSDVRKLRYKDNEFDQTTALEVIEHVPEWEKSVLEMIRITRKRVVITVPYNERLSYGDCPRCGKEIFIDGHLHKFNEGDFLKFGRYGKVSFEKIYHPYKLKDFLRRGRRMFSEGKKVSEEKGKDGEIKLKVICQNCYWEKGYRGHFLRTINRIKKILFRKPEHLLVRIDLKDRNS